MAIFRHRVWECINGHEAIVMGQSVFSHWEKFVRAESVLYRSHLGNACGPVGNTEVHENLSYKRQRYINFL